MDKLALSIFFVISGILNHKLIDGGIGAPDGLISLRNFYARRACGSLPPFTVTYFDSDSMAFQDGSP